MIPRLMIVLALLNLALLVSELGFNLLGTLSLEWATP
jgi:hypothetical protein